MMSYIFLLSILLLILGLIFTAEHFTQEDAKAVILGGKVSKQKTEVMRTKTKIVCGECGTGMFDWEYICPNCGSREKTKR